MRAANTYRGHPERVKKHEWQTEPVRRRRHHPPVRLNRSKKWKEAATYSEARAQRMPIAAE